MTGLAAVKRVNNYLQPFWGRYEDSFQQGRVDILECDPQTLEEIASTIRRVKNRAIKQYFVDLSASADPSGIQKSSWSGEYSYLPINSDRHQADSH
jgi:hypothetical protein